MENLSIKASIWDLTEAAKKVMPVETPVEIEAEVEDEASEFLIAGELEDAPTPEGTPTEIEGEAKLRQRKIASAIKRLNAVVANLVDAGGILTISQETVKNTVVEMRQKYPAAFKGDLTEEEIDSELSVSLDRLRILYFLYLSIYYEALGQTSKTLQIDRPYSTNIASKLWSFLAPNDDNALSERYKIADQLYGRKTDAELEADDKILSNPRRADEFSNFIKPLIAKRKESIQTSIKEAFNPAGTGYGTSMEYIEDQVPQAFEFQFIKMLIYYYAKATKADLPKIDSKIISATRNPYFLINTVSKYSVVGLNRLTEPKNISTFSSHERDDQEDRAGLDVVSTKSEDYMAAAKEAGQLAFQEVEAREEKKPSSDSTLSTAEDFLRSSENLLGKYFPNASFSSMVNELIIDWNNNDQWPILLSDEGDLDEIPLFLWLRNLEEGQLAPRKSMKMMTLPEADFIEVLSNIQRGASKEYAYEAMKLFISRWDPYRFTLRSLAVQELVRRKFAPDMLSSIKTAEKTKKEQIKAATPKEDVKNKEGVAVSAINALTNSCTAIINNLGAFQLEGVSIDKPAQLLAWIRKAPLQDVKIFLGQIVSGDLIGAKDRTFDEFTTKGRTAVENAIRNILSVKQGSITEARRDLDPIPREFNLAELTETLFNYFINTVMAYSKPIISELHELLAFMIKYAQNPELYEDAAENIPDFKGASFKRGLRLHLLEEEEYQRLYKMYKEAKASGDTFVPTISDRLRGNLGSLYDYIKENVVGQPRKELVAAFLTKDIAQIKAAVLKHSNTLAAMLGTENRLAKTIRDLVREQVSSAPISPRELKTDIRRIKPKEKPEPEDLNIEEIQAGRKALVPDTETLPKL